MDIVRPLLRRTRDEQAYLRFSKVSTVFWGLALLIVAYLSREVVFVLNAAFSLRGLTSGALLGALFLTILWKRGRPAPPIIGMIAAFCVMVGLSLNWLPAPKIDWPWFTLIGTAVTLIVATIVRALLPDMPPASPAAGLPNEQLQQTKL
jgi:Na+/proline symporter